MQEEVGKATKAKEEEAKQNKEEEKKAEEGKDDLWKAKRPIHIFNDKDRAGC